MPGHLPIDPYIPAIVDALRRRRAAVVTAAPGAGKTTRVPPALVADGPVILLQPRRVAARAIAARIAAERSWTLGREVGWQIRFESSSSGVANRVIVCYRDATIDPVQGPTTTVAWRDPPASRPEQTLSGLTCSPA